MAKDERVPLPVLPDLAQRNSQKPKAGSWWVRLFRSPAFQARVARWPFLRGRVRREGEAMMGLVSGFVQSQCLMALVETGTLEHLRAGTCTMSELARVAQMPLARIDALARAGQAMGLVRLVHGETAVRLSLRGASLLGVPGLADMILHHKVLYRDLEDPTAFFRGQTEPELARFWSYVFANAEGKGGVSPQDAARYSTLMTRSQALVAQDTLAAVNLQGVGTLMDVGGGSGAFLAAVGAAYPSLRMMLFDLPAVEPLAQELLGKEGLLERVRIVPGSFREGSIPSGADAISLVRVCYDHTDETVSALLQGVFRALPAGGRLIVSEPMTGGATPTIWGDVYFQMYTMAMGTGRTRSAQTLAQMVREAGFCSIRTPAPKRGFVTSILTARKPTSG